MTDLVKCCPECDPVVQERGQMGPGDYFGVTLPNGQPDVNHHLKVEMHDAIRNDVRIACENCGAATGWGPKDFPNAPGAGLDFIVKRWNELATVKKTKADMLAILTREFGADNVAKHFAA
jgi:hypothetical protein